MQLLIILGIGFAIVSVMFALQNSNTVTVAFAIWHFEASLAIVLLLSLGLGALAAGLVSSPSIIRLGWANSRLKGRVTVLEEEKVAHRTEIGELTAELSRLKPDGETPKEEVKPYVGMKEIIAGRNAGKA